MRLTHIELHELALPLSEPFIISGGAMTVRRSLVVVIRDAGGYIGYGESPPFELPFYSEETLGLPACCWRSCSSPGCVGRELEGPEAVDALLREGVRGQPVRPRGARDRRVGPRGPPAGRRASPPCSPSGSASMPAARITAASRSASRPTARPATLARWIADALEHGYRRVKIKVAPGWDAEPVRAARAALAGTAIPLTVDANGGYEWPEHESNLRALDEAELLYIEQPLAPDELVGHARLAEMLVTPVCVDETLHGARTARQLVELGGPNVWNVKVHRMGGLTEVARVVADRARGRRSSLGRHDARVGARLAGRACGRGASRLRLPLRHRAQCPLVRPWRGRDRAAYGGRRHHGGARHVHRGPAGRNSVPPGDPPVTLGDHMAEYASSSSLLAPGLRRQCAVWASQRLAKLVCAPG